MFGLRRFARSHRHARLSRLLAGQCRRYLECYENARNYDMKHNGEHFVLEALSDQKPHCILDVGANVGEWALMAHEIFPDARIHCFEIVPATAKELARRTQGAAAIIVNDVGLADHAGQVAVRCFPEYSTLASIVAVPHRLTSHLDTGTVITGDEYLCGHSIAHVDFLKIDVEAAEGLVLRGFEGALNEQRIDIIQFEYGTGSIVTKFMLRDFYLYLEPKGYTIGKIYPNYVEFREYEFEHEDFYGPNYLAVRSGRPDLLELLGIGRLS
jgi:FkbM family methyltransferase